MAPVLLGGTAGAVGAPAGRVGYRAMRSRHAGCWALVLGACGLGVLVWGTLVPRGVPALSSEVVWTAAPEGIAPLGVVEGRVQDVDPFRGLLVLRIGGAPTSFRINEQTTVFLDGRTAELFELRPGDAVRTTFAPDRGLPMASWIERVGGEAQARRPAPPR